MKQRRCYWDNNDAPTPITMETAQYPRKLALLSNATLSIRKTKVKPSLYTP
jgi:hypothetical protein